VADVDLVSQVFDNLISNAIKYSKKGGKVEIRFTAEKRQWVFRVRDYGIGISEKGQKHLFKEFYRSDNAVNSEILGSGIGLLMVRNIVERHLGKVWFESRENKGSVFVVEMPYLFDMAPETESMDPVAASDSPVEKILGNFSAEDSSIEKHSSILVVEDNDKLRNFMYAALSSEFTVRTMANGKEAWDYIKQELPDLVISDVLMPEMDGFELCRLIKSGYETSHIPVILLTALSEKSDQMHGIGLGADAYVTKPFDMTLLIRQISTIISNRNLMRERLLDPVSDEATEGPLLENDLNEQFVRRAMQVVRDNMSNPEFGKDDFASQMNVSGSLLYKKVKSLTGLSPTDLIKSARMKKAMDLLITKRYTITEVSEMCGFSSVAYFSTVFRKHYGKPPSEFLL
jgi:DNA-binding response OmpR family regulator